VNPAPAPLATAWPRPAQLAAAFLLGAAAGLLAVHLWGGGPPKPLDLRHLSPSSHVIDLNHADRAEIRQLPGVGPTLAARISANRDEGGFRTVDDLRTVAGMGPARLERVRPWVQAGDQEPAGMAAPSGRTSKKTETLKDVIDVNSATAEQLQKLPGIGPKLAQRILDDRAKAPFKSVEDLRRVSGIGPKTLEKLRPYVTVGQPE
jgi:competence protein ComEA